MRIEQADGAVLLRLEGGKANALSATWLASFQELLRAALAGPPGALVLTGYERFFSGGLDLPSLLSLDRAALSAFLGVFTDAMMALFDAERPVVAAINGHAIAGGCVLALQADYRIMAAGPWKMGLNEVQLGIGLPAVVLETLRWQLPPRSLREVALEGRLLPPEEAQRVGMVQEVVEPAALLPAALAKARELSALPPGAFAAIKRALRAPARAAVHAASVASAPEWVDGWFSAEAQQRIAAAVARLGGGSR